MSLKYKLAEAFVKFRARCGRGSSFTGEIQGFVNAFSQGGIILLIVDRFFDILLPLWILPLVWLFQKMVEYSIGRYDEKYLGLWHLEARYIPYNIDPWKKEVLGRIKNIEEQQNPETVASPPFDNTSKKHICSKSK